MAVSPVATLCAIAFLAPALEAAPGFLAQPLPFRRSAAPPRQQGVGPQLIQGSSFAATFTTVAVVPTANDTVSKEYYQMIDQAIAEAAATTEAPPMGQGYNNYPSGTKSPVESVIAASTAHSGPSAEDLTPEEINQAIMLNPLLDPRGAWTHGKQDKVSLVPYDMQIGAQIMNRLSEPTSTPPPSQQIVSEQFVAECPMIMFKDSITVSAPRCGETFGEWTDPETQRTILRWKPATAGGVYFGVDSVVDGNGSVMYANFDQTFALNGIEFQLTNCKQTTRYTVEETIMKVDHIGVGITSSVQAHDVSRTKQAFFYKYTIRHVNGSAVAETSMYRMNQNQINVTMFRGGEFADGPLLATANKQGTWTQDDWRQCTGTKRAWELDFKLGESDFETVSTVADLRVATAAMITLMAYRDETINVQTGVTRQGEKGMVSQFLLGIFLVILALSLLLALQFFAKRRGWDAKMRRLCFKFEAAFLPKRPAFERKPAFPTSY